MSVGSVLAAGCVAAWAYAPDVAAMYLAFTGIGLAGAAVLYEPAFATVNAWFDARRRDALLTVTMVAGAGLDHLSARVRRVDRLVWLASCPARAGRSPGVHRDPACPAPPAAPG